MPGSEKIEHPDRATILADPATIEALKHMPISRRVRWALLEILTKQTAGKDSAQPSQHRGD